MANEFFRRLGYGRLSEVFGEDFVEVDRYFRLITAAGINKKIPDEISLLYNSFTAGVNSYLTGHHDRLPLEFKLLRHKPEAWSAEDFIAIIKVVNWGLSAGWKIDITAGQILKKVGTDKFREAFPAGPGNSPIIIPQQSKLSSISTESYLRTMSVIEKLADISSLAVSNNWVVTGKKTVSGKPLLANDPHLLLANPPFWWEAHLNCPTMNVSGYAIAGVPGILMGHNRNVAWGVTNVVVDDVDFFIEKINPDNPRQYLYQGRWEEMKVVEETIRVKGKDPVITEILLTRHGPILTEITQGSEPQAISVKWAFTEGLQPAKASYSLAKAKDVNDVTDALKEWELPCQNFVFADTKGNIGFWCCAKVPIRARGDGLLPVPGWTGAYEWQGYVPVEKLPHLINPAQGFIATANTRVAGENYPYFISHYYEPMDRITRIRQLLNAKEKFSVEDMQQMQQDVYSVLASELTPQIIQVLDGISSDSDAESVKKIMAQWDFKVENNSVAACLFEVTVRNMMENIFKDELGPELFQKYLETILFPPRAIRALISKASSAWFDDINSPQKETKEDIIAISVAQTIQQLKKEFGNDKTTWIWGKKHTLTFEHALGKKKPLDYIFNIGPFPVGGSHLTINKKQFSYQTPYHANVGASYRMIVDFSNMSVAQHVLPTGESGQIGSPHYKDQVDLYLNGKYHPAWIERTDVDQHAEGTFILKPKIN